MSPPAAAAAASRAGTLRRIASPPKSGASTPAAITSGGWRARRYSTRAATLAISRGAIFTARSYECSCWGTS